jgi:hypothetical protein
MLLPEPSQPALCANREARRARPPGLVEYRFRQFSAHIERARVSRSRIGRGTAYPVTGRALAAIGTGRKCQFPTHAPQRTLSLSIISSARPSSGSGTVTLSGVAEKTSSRTLLRSQHKD